MRIAILSDIHANLEALAAFREDYDELWVLGDLVNYGPDPAAAVEWVRAHATVVVRGNHDHCIGFNQDPRCSPRYREMAAATRALTAAALGAGQKRWLRALPVNARCEVQGVRFLLCHAVPDDPFVYRPADSDAWAHSEADVLLAGHTHIPFTRAFGARWAGNPGSLGQPKTGEPRACYAVWEDGRLELKAVDYDYEATVRKIEALPLAVDVRRDLAGVLRTGGRL